VKKLVAVLLCVLLAACEPAPPRHDYGHCLAGHTESSMQLQYAYGLNGGNYQPVLVPATEFVCDKHEYPLGDGPGYVADVERYKREMVEYRKDHPAD
jgi:hypothetical protein